MISWDPSGRLLASRGVGECELRVWVNSRTEGLACWDGLPHASNVSEFRWCNLWGIGEEKHLLLAR